MALVENKQWRAILLSLMSSQPDMDLEKMRKYSLTVAGRQADTNDRDQLEEEWQAFLKSRMFRKGFVVQRGMVFKRLSEDPPPQLTPGGPTSPPASQSESFGLKAAAAHLQGLSDSEAADRQHRKKMMKKLDEKEKQEKLSQSRKSSLEMAVRYHLSQRAAEEEAKKSKRTAEEAGGDGHSKSAKKAKKAKTEALAVNESDADQSARKAKKAKTEAPAVKEADADQSARKAKKVKDAPVSTPPRQADAHAEIGGAPGQRDSSTARKLQFLAEKATSKTDKQADVSKGAASKGREASPATPTSSGSSSSSSGSDSDSDSAPELAATQTYEPEGETREQTQQPKQNGQNGQKKQKHKRQEEEQQQEEQPKEKENKKKQKMEQKAKATAAARADAEDEKDREREQTKKQAAKELKAPGSAKGVAGSAAEDEQNREEQTKQKKRKKLKAPGGGSGKGRADEDEAGPSNQEEGPIPEEVIIPPSKPGEKPIKVMAATHQLPWKLDSKRTDVKSGPFSKAEKDIVRRVVRYYANEKNLPTDSYEWIFSGRQGRSNNPARGLWQFVARALPHRTSSAVNSAGIRMLNPGNHKGMWSAEENGKLKELVDKYGHEWQKISEETGRFRGSCRDRWKEEGGTNKKKGRWSADEEKLLVDAVQEQLKAGRRDRASAAIDGINWEKLATELNRNSTQCRSKWYDQLRGKSAVPDADAWTNESDMALVDALHSFVQENGAMYNYEIAWGKLVPNKSAQEVKQRWRYLVRHVPTACGQELPEQVESVLATFKVIEEGSSDSDSGDAHVKEEEEEEDQGDKEDGPASDGVAEIAEGQQEEDVQEGEGSDYEALRDGAGDHDGSASSSSSSSSSEEEEEEVKQQAKETAEPTEAKEASVGSGGTSSSSGSLETGSDSESDATQAPDAEDSD